jgi:hypothetical protein
MDLSSIHWKKQPGSLRGMGNSHDAYFQVLKSHAALHFNVFKGIVVFINLPFSFCWMDDKSGIRASQAKPSQSANSGQRLA